MSIEYYIDRELSQTAYVLEERGTRNKHDIPWAEYLSDAFAIWLVSKFLEEEDIL